MSLGGPGRRTAIRGAAPARRPPSIRRATPRLTRVRAGAVLAILAASTAMFGLGTSEAFGLARLDVEGARWTEAAAIEAAVDVPLGTNLFGVETGPVRAALEALPAIERASAEVALPDALVVRVTEREPILAWRTGEQRHLVDRNGFLFAEVVDGGPVAPSSLPEIDDRRPPSTNLVVGSQLDPVDLAAATQLASLVPADLGSAAARLAVRVTDASGFIVLARPDGWSAVFGFYTPTLRSTEMIPGQVQLLRSLLCGREATVERVILASETDGTYIPRVSASPSASRAP
jgi:cell division septal protein FtsQ